MSKRLLSCGLLAAIAYVVTVVVGGAVTPGYDHLSQAISELIAAGAPKERALDLAFSLYNLLLAAFAAGLISGYSGERSLRVSGWLLVLVAACGLAMDSFFPMDMVGAPTTSTGGVHWALAGVAALATMVALVLAGLAWQRSDRGALGTYSLVTAAVMFVSGGTGALTTGLDWPYFGLIERVTIGSFVLWLAVASLVLARASKTTHARRLTGAVG